jgi:hypothetical protein
MPGKPTPSLDVDRDREPELGGYERIGSMKYRIKLLSLTHLPRTSGKTIRMLFG